MVMVAVAVVMVGVEWWVWVWSGGGGGGCGVEWPLYLQDGEDLDSVDLDNLQGRPRHQHSKLVAEPEYGVGMPGNSAPGRPWTTRVDGFDVCAWGRMPLGETT